MLDTAIGLKNKYKIYITKGIILLLEGEGKS